MRWLWPMFGLLLGGLLVTMLPVVGGAGIPAGLTAPAATPTPTPGSVDLLAVDTNVVGNTADEVGTIDECAEVSAIGQGVAVDVVIRGIPPSQSSGAAFDLLYDPSVLQVTSFTGTIKYSGAFTFASDPVPDVDGDFRAEIALFSNYVAGDGTVARFWIEAVGTGTSDLRLDDLGEEDGMPDIYDLVGGVYSVATLTNSRIVVGSPCAAADSDGDGVPDASDNCPNWPNTAQTLPVWTVPANDGDCDGFNATIESHIGTDPAQQCPNTATANDEATDAWPPDFNDSKSTNLSDVILIGPSYNKSQGQAGYDVRFDLNSTNSVNLSDVILMGPFYNKSCG